MLIIFVVLNVCFAYLLRLQMHDSKLPPVIFVLFLSYSLHIQVSRITAKTREHSKAFDNVFLQ